MFSNDLNKQLESFQKHSPFVLSDEHKNLINLYDSLPFKTVTCIGQPFDEKRFTVGKTYDVLVYSKIQHNNTHGYGFYLIDNHGNRCLELEKGSANFNTTYYNIECWKINK
jgi:hypothetical protein